MKQLVFLIALAILSVACVNTMPRSSLQADSSIKILRVGISADSPPIAYKEGGRIAGLEAELAKGLADFTDRRLNLIQLDWKDQIPSLLSGKTDIIMSGMTATDSRGYRIAFTDPYMVSGQITLIKRINRSKFSAGMTDLLNPSVRIGTVTGTTGDYFIQDIKANGARTQFPTSAMAVKALLSDKIDAFVYDLPGNLYLASKYTDEGLFAIAIPLTREYIAWGVRPDDREMLSAANRYIKSLTNQGVLTEIIQRWMPYYKP